jgi:hypothetical protein
MNGQSARLGGRNQSVQVIVPFSFVLLRAVWKGLAMVGRWWWAGWQAMTAGGAVGADAVRRSGTPARPRSRVAGRDDGSAWRRRSDRRVA